MTSAFNECFYCEMERNKQIYVIDCVFNPDKFELVFEFSNKFQQSSMEVH